MTHHQSLIGEQFCTDQSLLALDLWLPVSEMKELEASIDDLLSTRAIPLPNSHCCPCLSMDVFLPRLDGTKTQQYFQVMDI